MKIVVTGTSGQLATALKHRSVSHVDKQLISVGRPILDLDRPKDIAETIAAHRPDLVVSAAAWTAVDLAEDEPEAAMRANGDSAGQVAVGAAMVGAPVIHLSTDYVYDGTTGGAWKEDDPVNPLSVYGETKLAGERNVRDANSKHIILRTSWVYSPFGKNFVRTMLQLAANRSELDVVDDQYGCPTSAFDLADGIFAIADRLISDVDQIEAIYGIYHIAGSGTATWSDLATETFRLAEAHDLPSAQVNSVATSAFPTKAVRPVNSRLDCTKLEKTFGFRCPPWFLSLERCVEYIATQPKNA